MCKFLCQRCVLLTNTVLMCAFLRKNTPLKFIGQILYIWIAITEYVQSAFSGPLAFSCPNTCNAEGTREFYLKGYLHYKTIFSSKIALNVQLMNFFISRKNNVSFLRYLDFCVFVKYTDFKIRDVIIYIFSS